MFSVFCFGAHTARRFQADVSLNLLGEVPFGVHAKGCASHLLSPAGKERVVSWLLPNPNLCMYIALFCVHLLPRSVLLELQQLPVRDTEAHVRVVVLCISAGETRRKQTRGSASLLPYELSNMFACLFGRCCMVSYTKCHFSPSVVSCGFAGGGTDNRRRGGANQEPLCIAERAVSTLDKSQVIAITVAMLFPVGDRSSSTYLQRCLYT